LGTVFLYSYYSLYDFTNGKIGFNGDYINFNTDTPDNPTPEKDASSPFGLIILIILLVLAILAGGFYLFKRYQDKKTQEKLN
jgi:uncharacterized protein HemX